MHSSTTAWRRWSASSQTVVPTQSVTKARALVLTDRLCWDSLERGDPAVFTCQAAICAELRDFGICARLLEER